MLSWYQSRSYQPSGFERTEASLTVKINTFRSSSGVVWLALNSSIAQRLSAMRLIHDRMVCLQGLEACC